jgi:hypothetical protein
MLYGKRGVYLDGPEDLPGVVTCRFHSVFGSHRFKIRHRAERSDTVCLPKKNISFQLELLNVSRI